MSWSIGYDKKWKRDIGYGVPAYCDRPGCDKVIDRGLAFVCCDSKPYGGERGCGLYFCEEHHPFSSSKHSGMCIQCIGNRNPFPPKPDHPDWIKHKLEDESWQKWRDENPEQVIMMMILKK